MTSSTLVHEDQQEILTHLENLLADKRFASAERNSNFLRFVVNAALEGRAAELKETVIATEVYGRPNDYDPKADSIVRVEASRLRQKLRGYYASEGQASAMRIHLPSGSYAPTFERVDIKEQVAHPPPEAWRRYWRIGAGACSACHSGPMLDRTNRFFPLSPVGSRFQSVGVSEFNPANNPVRQFIFRNADGTETTVTSPDPGRALITGVAQDANFFKVSPLRGIRRSAPYFHDNSARTLEQVVAHYAKLFAVVFPPNALILTPQDQADIVAYLKLLE